MFSMPVKVNFDGGECCWEEEEEEEEELCCGRAGGGKAGSPFKEGSFVGFLLWCRQQNPSSFYFWDSYLRITIQKSIHESHNFPNDPIIKS